MRTTAASDRPPSSAGHPPDLCVSTAPTPRRAIRVGPENPEQRVDPSARACSGGLVPTFGCVTTMYGELCRWCAKRIGSEGPGVLGREGAYYHFNCWCQRMDVLVQEQRDKLKAQRMALKAQR